TPSAARDILIRRPIEHLDATGCWTASGRLTLTLVDLLPWTEPRGSHMRELWTTAFELYELCCGESFETEKFRSGCPHRLCMFHAHPLTSGAERFFRLAVAAFQSQGTTLERELLPAPA